MNPAEALIDHALAVRWSKLSTMERAATLALLDDSLCVGIAGARAAHADAVLAVAGGWGDGGACGVLGRPGTRLPPASAAFVNAFQIHGQEFDCVHEAAVLHPMASVLAALLAEAGRGAPIDGATFLAAVVAGVDVAVTLGLAATGPLTFFRPATAGIFGCVAALARARTLPRAVALDAFGHALAFAAGTMQAHVEGRPALPLQVANAARGALVAFDLACAGVPGVARPIDGVFGYLALFERASDPAAFRDLQTRVGEVSLKPFPTGRAAHGGIIAVQAMMREHGLTADSLVSLEYHAPPLIARLVGRPAVAGMEPGYARLCLPWLVAVTLTRGTVGLDALAADIRADPALLALAARVKVVADGNPDPAAFVPAVAVARVRGDARKVTVPIASLLGAPGAWPTDAQREAKARDCLAFAYLGERRGAMQRALATIDHAPDALAVLAATGVL